MAGFDVRFEDLDALLEQEADALRRLDSDLLQDLAQVKDGVGSALAEGRVALTGEQARQLRKRADRNDALYKATLSGMRAALDRLADTRRVSGHLDTYNAKGERQDILRATGSFEKRA